MKKETGFSLLEILITVIILAITALFLAKLNGLTHSGISNASERQVATRIAEGILEGLRQQARSRTSLPSTPTINNVIFATGNGSTSTPYTGTVTGRTSTYNVYLSFSPPPNWTTNNSIFNAQVQITWKDRADQNQTVVLVSNLYVPTLASTESSAPQRPTKLCRWNNSPEVYPQGSWIIHGSNAGKEKVYYCFKAGGCPKDNNNTPEARTTLWKHMGDFEYASVNIGNGNECKPPNADGSFSGNATPG